MRTTYLNDWNADLLDEYYQRWKQDPASVDSSWSAFFEGFELGLAPGRNGNEQVAAPAAAAEGEKTDELRDHVNMLVTRYRRLGHLQASLDPLADTKPKVSELSLEAMGLAGVPLNRTVSSMFFRSGAPIALGELVDTLNKAYCDDVGVEFYHIQDEKIRDWVRDHIEARVSQPPPDPETQKAYLRCLMEAETFEQFVHTKFIGQKRFSLQGGESLMVILETILAGAPQGKVDEIVMGMAHRGRLTVLANFLKKSYRTIFREFSENYIPDLVAGDGDVKYHLGYESVRKTDDAEVGIRLAANPSHLEIVNPVVEGKARARQRILGATEQRSRVLPLLIHGDAAFAGQGIVAETLNLSQLAGYETGGTIHIIVNNQIGFTTLPADARSTTYCTDVAKMIEAPIFHVNGDHPISVAFVAALALDFRQQFGRDVVIDMYCYRRYGHNETDEPGYTQPKLYKVIQAHPPVTKLFKEQLLKSGVLTAEDADALEKEFRARLEAALQEVQSTEAKSNQEFRASFEESTAVFQPPYSHKEPVTSVTREALDLVVDRITQVPEGFRVQPQIRKMVLDRRRKLHADGGPYDWAFGEALAFGTLLAEGIPVRLSGQDSRRGTFSQRHSVLYDAETQERYIPLKNIKPDQAWFCVYNSMLSEAAVLGFDYGYCIDYPEMLCLWEAQFGDFVNGAQVVIDQFIVSSESKWQRPSGIVLLLPHGYEGQGPEHSSARLERFLQLCAEDNIQVCYPTTPAQYFHMLRRQVKRDFRKPLVVMTPKSLLRNEKAVSRIEDFTDHGFRTVLGPTSLGEPKEVRRVIFCTGKVYYDLLKYQEANKRNDTALVRIEQLYPLSFESIEQAIEPLRKVSSWVWCQEEPQNMGAWTYMDRRLEQVLKHRAAYAGRGAAASPAEGAKAWHDRAQKELVEQAFSI